MTASHETCKGDRDVLPNKCDVTGIELFNFPSALLCSRVFVLLLFFFYLLVCFCPYFTIDDIFSEPVHSIS